MASPIGLVGTSWPWNVAPTWVYDEDVIEQAIRDVILTAIRERKMMPEYGSETLSVVFENKGTMLQALAKRTISLALSTYLPSVRVLNIDVDEGDSDTEEVVINVDYEYIGRQGTVNVTTSNE